MAAALVATSWAQEPQPVQLPAALAISAPAAQADNPPIKRTLEAISAAWDRQRQPLQLAPALAFSGPVAPAPPLFANKSLTTIAAAWVKRPTPVQLSPALAINPADPPPPPPPPPAPPPILPLFTNAPLAAAIVEVSWDRSWQPPVPLPRVLPLTVAVDNPPVTGRQLDAVIAAAWARPPLALQLPAALAISALAAPDAPPLSVGSIQIELVVSTWGRRPQPLQLSPALVIQSPSAPPPFAGGARVPRPVLIGWLPAPPRPPSGQVLAPPSGPAPDNPPFAGGARISQSALNAWLPPPPRPPSAHNLTPPTGRHPRPRPRPVVLGYPAVPLWGGGPMDVWVNRIGDVLRNVLQGRLNVTLDVTLDTGSSTTVLVDQRISAQSALILVPLSANAAAIQGSTYVSSRQAGTATLSHPVTADLDCSFTIVILG